MSLPWAEHELARFRLDVARDFFDSGASGFGDEGFAPATPAGVTLLTAQNAGALGGSFLVEDGVTYSIKGEARYALLGYDWDEDGRRDVYVVPWYAPTGAQTARVTVISGETGSVLVEHVFDGEHAWPLGFIGTGDERLEVYRTRETAGKIHWGSVTVHVSVVTAFALDADGTEVWRLAGEILEDDDERLLVRNPDVTLASTEGGVTRLVVRDIETEWSKQDGGSKNIVELSVRDPRDLSIAWSRAFDDIPWIAVADADPWRIVTSHRGDRFDGVTAWSGETGEELWRLRGVESGFDAGIVLPPPHGLEDRLAFLASITDGGLVVGVLTMDGAIVWQKELPATVQGVGVSGAGRVANGAAVLLVRTWEPGSQGVLALDGGTGALLWQKARSANEFHYVVFAGDLTKDGVAEVAFVAQPTSWSGGPLETCSGGKRAMVHVSVVDGRSGEAIVSLALDGIMQPLGSRAATDRFVLIERHRYGGEEEVLLHILDPSTGDIETRYAYAWWALGSYGSGYGVAGAAFMDKAGVADRVFATSAMMFASGRFHADAFVHDLATGENVVRIATPREGAQPFTVCSLLDGHGLGLP